MELFTNDKKLKKYYWIDSFRVKEKAAAKKEEDHMPGTEAGVPVIEQGVHSVLSRKLEMPRSVLFVVQSG